MNKEELKKLKEAFNTWAQARPGPNAPVMKFAGETKFYSAQEMANEIENETPAGRDMLAILEHGVAVEGIDKVVARLTHNNPPQP